MAKNKNSLSKESFLQSFPIPTEKEWLTAVETLLQGKPFEKSLLTETYENITLKPLYTSKDISNQELADTRPGLPPFIRGSSVSGSPWLIAQEVRGSSTEQLNQNIRYAIKNGQTAIALNMNESPAIHTLKDLKTVLASVDLTNFPMFIRSDTSCIAYAGLLEAYSEERGMALDALAGAIEYDPITLWAEKGTLASKRGQLLGEVRDLTIWAREKTPKLFSVFINGSTYHNSGANAVQEVAISIATGVEYMRTLQKNESLSVDDITTRMKFCLGLSTHFFMEIAKFRAIRLLWCKIIEAFGASKSAQSIHIHATTSLRNKTQLDAHTNLLRTTTEAMAGIIGGCDTLTVHPFDMHFAQPNDFSERLARNIHYILKEEAHLDKVIDPGGGSYFIESLTNEIATKAWTLFQKIEAMGGMVEALGEGFPQAECMRSAEKQNTNLALKNNILIGVNQYPNPSQDEIHDSKSMEISGEHARSEKSSITQLPGINIDRNASPTEIVSQTSSAFREGATLPDVVASLQRGQEKTIPPLQQQRFALIFEKLRMRAVVIRTKTGSFPQIYLLNFGTLKELNARIEFVTDFIGVGGFQIKGGEFYSDYDPAVKAFLKSKLNTLILCAKDEDYAGIATKLIDKIRDSNPATQILIAGHPKEAKQLLASGITDFIHQNTDAIKVLSTIFDHLEKSA